MQFTRLRLHGFKSFVEPADLDIAGGLTGIVGPNGCGKSNLVEALRWVMGETSPKRMRGSEMDDVIFAGTATRPSRNLASVRLDLDNSDHSSTGEYNDEKTLQITREIERGGGSTYRINGKPVRQRDVQLVFADAATGAHSTNLVGQGQIDALIRAKPQDRRQLLEEASGTSGLQARRHEAELKLKAAEQNIQRVDDVLKSYEGQLRSLKQQIKQSSHYKNLAEKIRKTDAALLKLRWDEAEVTAEQKKQALENAEKSVNELLVIVTKNNTARTEIAAELPELRTVEAAASAIVQKITIAREQVESEGKRIAQEIAEKQKTLAQAQQDTETEAARKKDSTEAVAKLTAEQQSLEEKSASIIAHLPETKLALDGISKEVEALDRALSASISAAAARDAKYSALQQEIDMLKNKRQNLMGRREQIESQRAKILGEITGQKNLSFAGALVETSEKELSKKQEQAVDAESALRMAEVTQNTKREIWQDAQAKTTKAKAEADAINSLLNQNTDDATSQKVIDLITVEPGFETALAVALGEALTAGLDKTSPMHWRAVDSTSSAPSLPQGATPISDAIKAPDALKRALSQIGVVASASEGERIASYLIQGQVIVSRDGWAWRWDGFTVTPEAKTTTAIRLQHRNRLISLQKEIAEYESAQQCAEADLQNARAELNAKQIADKQAREGLKSAFAAVNEARTTYGAQEREAAALTNRLGALDESLQQVMKDLEEIRARVSDLEQSQEGLRQTAEQTKEITDQKERLTEKRTLQASQQSKVESLQREQSIYQERSKTIATELKAWATRMSGAEEQQKLLTERIAMIDGQLAELARKPAELHTKQQHFIEQLATAEGKRQIAGDNLVMAENRLRAIEGELKENENKLTTAKETRVREQGAIVAADEQFKFLREKIAEKLGCEPPALGELAGTITDSADDLERKVKDYQEERDNMGPVNLRAEVESEALQEQMNKLTTEKEDLVSAIAKLRHGIGQLNREAKERLEQAFGKVNERFQVLFKRMFGGGKAHLELIDDADPLNSGLEIFASPPGKKMQVLTLLSGGEKTLTALALLFAVFQTNPSPICVLDEAEAALDESNIGRFCDLVNDIGRETGTRFIIITHQRLTMARMDRLYGVTMSEKGVSQLVSVDLEGAVAIRDGEKINKAEKILADVEAA